MSPKIICSLKLIVRCASLMLIAGVCISSRPACALGEKQHVTTLPVAESFALVQRQSVAKIYVDSADWPGVLLAANSFSSDVSKVTGRSPEIIHAHHGKDRELILIGTIGRSAVIDRLIAEHKLDVSAIRGHWEMSVTQIVQHPMRGVRSALVIAGADNGVLFMGSTTSPNR